MRSWVSSTVNIALLRGGAVKSLARPTSRCRSTESIVSLERGVCSCAGLQVLQLLVQLKDILKEKRRGSSPKGSCSCKTMPRLTGHLQPTRDWSTWASNVLITHPIPRIWPRRTTTCPLDWKNNWKVAIFLPTRSSLLPRRPGCTDNLLIFFLGCLAKVRATG